VKPFSSFPVIPEDGSIIHVGIWKVKSRPPPRIHSPPAELYADYSDSQIPPWDDNYSDPDYPFEAYM
jgi:hypothetical protein